MNAAAFLLQSLAWAASCCALAYAPGCERHICRERSVMFSGDVSVIRSITCDVGATATVEKLGDSAVLRCECRRARDGGSK